MHPLAKTPVSYQDDQPQDFSAWENELRTTPTLTSSAWAGWFEEKP